MAHKGHKPWNLGLTKDNDSRVKANGESVSKSKKGCTAWNKGLTGVQEAWNKGIPQSDEHRKHNSESKIGKIASEETKKKMSESHKGKHWNWEEESKQRASDSRNEFIKLHPEKIKKGKDHYAYGKTGKLCHLFGKTTSHPKKIFPHQTPLQGLLLMHRWDRKKAQYLDSINEPYLYESKAFPLVLKGKDTCYIPDFYLPNKDLYIEVKGYFRGDAEPKFNEFLIQYPNIKIQLLMEKDLKLLGIDLKPTSDEIQIIEDYKKKKEDNKKQDHSMESK